VATQQFGQIETGGGVAEAMLCIDADRPSEIMLHCYGAGTTPVAALFEATKSGCRLDLTPKLIYRLDNGEGLYLPPTLSEEELKWRDHARAFLTEAAGSFHGEWTGPDGKHGRMRFADVQTPGQLQARKCRSWKSFKEWASEVRTKSDAVCFRGHGNKAFRLQSTLHRAGRRRLERYCADELPDFTHHAEATLGLRLNLSDSADYSTVLGLAQHHGLPTPMLDWTGSPYVAAYFAFADALESASARPSATHVRVFALARRFVENTSPPLVTVPKVRPYVASLSISARNNPRLYAQRGRFLVTNVADLEGYLRFLEKNIGERFLFAADVPIACAAEALEDLEFMGLSAATLFPGLDGVCRMMKHQMNFKRPQVRLPTTSSASAPAAPAIAEPAGDGLEAKAPWQLSS
jgi:FRG domain